MDTTNAKDVYHREQAAQDFLDDLMLEYQQSHNHSIRARGLY